MERCSFWLLTAVFAAACLAMCADGQKAFAENGDEPVNLEFDRYVHPYFVLNTVEPAPKSSTRTGVAANAEEFAALFGIGRVMGPRPKEIPDGYFDSHKVVYFIEWGKVPWDYQVKEAAVRNGVLVVKCTKDGKPSEAATFAPHIIIGFEGKALEGVKKVSFEFLSANAAEGAKPEIVSADL